MNIFKTTPRTRGNLKLLGYVMFWAGLAIGFFDYFGAFNDKRKLSFAQTLMSRDDEIPRTTPGFDLFIRSFPPPQGVDETEVSAIADRTLRVNSRSDVGTTMSYVAGGKVTGTMA